MFTHAEFERVRRFSGLDGLRAIAILAVIFHHLARFPAGWRRQLQENASSGVSLFFVISGFLITTLLLRERREVGRIDLRRFLIRRGIRLWPAYYAVLGAVLLVSVWTHAFSARSVAVLWHDVPAYVLYYSNWLPAKEGPFFFAWSLATEEQFYLGFSVLLWLAPRWVIRPAMLATLGLEMVFHLAQAGHVPPSLTLRAISSLEEPILWGVVLALILATPTGFERLRPWLARPATVATALAVWFGWAAMPQALPGHALAEHLIFPAMAALVGWVVVRPPSRLLDAAPLVALGQLSYGMYLLHWFVLVTLERRLPRGTALPTVFVAAVVLTAFLAYLLARVVERPLASWLRRRLLPAAAPVRVVELPRLSCSPEVIAAPPPAGTAPETS